MTDKEKYINLAELKKKVRYWAKTRGMSDSSLQNFLSMISNLPVTSLYHGYKPRYCSNCGAKFDEEEEE